VAYVAEVGTVLSPLHVHQFKYHQKCIPGRHGRKLCDGIVAGDSGGDSVR
jgi:hypothetical protein